MGSWAIENHDRRDDQKIFDLQHLVYPEHHVYRDADLTRSLWQWRYFSHPDIISKVYVVKGNGGDVIAGMRPVTYLPLQIKGKEVCSVWLTAVITHPDFRKQGIFSGLVRHSLEDGRKSGAVFAFTFPNERSYAIYKKKPQWRYLGSMPLYIKLLRPLQLLAFGLGKLPVIRKFVYTNYNDSKGHVNFMEIVADNPEVRIRTAKKINEDYDRLWRNVAVEFKIAVKRDSAYLKWRYIENPVAHYTIFEARNPKDNNLKGYLVAAIQVRGRLVLGLIIDILVETAEPSVSQRLIAEACKYFRKNRAYAAGCLMNRKMPYARSLIRCGFLPVYDWMSPKTFHVIWYPLQADAEFIKLISDFDNWYLTWGDTDNV